MAASPGCQPSAQIPKTFAPDCFSSAARRSQSHHSGFSLESTHSPVYCSCDWAPLETAPVAVQLGTETTLLAESAPATPPHVIFKNVKVPKSKRRADPRHAAADLMAWGAVLLRLTGDISCCGETRMGCAKSAQKGKPTLTVYMERSFLFDRIIIFTFTLHFVYFL